MSLGKWRLGVACSCLLLIAACDSSEERAEKHYQSSLELLAEGDVPRALVELRNVLALDKDHRDARAEYARQSRQIGNFAEAYSNYLKIAEQFPDDMEARLALSQMAILNFNWREAERHGGALIEANAEIEGRDVIELALQFREALNANDDARIGALTADAEALFDSRPDDPILHRILIEGFSSANRFEDAVAVTDRAIEADPDNKLFYDVKTGLLANLGDRSAMEEHLRAAVAAFPEETAAKTDLVRMFVSDGRPEEAEQLLRDFIDASDDKVEAHISLISFIRELKGPDAALAEIETALGLYENPRLLSALKAGILFDTGRPDDAISLMQSVVEGAPDSDETDRLKIALAKMLEATGNEVGARQLVEAVLNHDPGQVDALKMTATWMIENDQTTEAITTLRQALDQEPEDAETMTLMARAHERNGDSQLAQDLIALAVEASGNAPAETLRYVSILVGQENYSAAETTLVNSLRRNPGDTRLLSQLGKLYVATEDWGRAQQVEATLRGQTTADAQSLADELRLQIFASREGSERGIEFLEELAARNTGAIAPRIALIRAQLSEEKWGEALALAELLAEDEPDNLQTQLVLGSTQFAVQEFAAAEQTFRKILEKEDNSLAAMQLIRSVGSQGRADEIPGIVDEMLTRLPDNPDLLWAKASLLERDNDVEGAIAIYERLYEQDSNSAVIANNLASLLVTYRDDDESLERAFVVGRRLRDTTVPPFQDTYGWLLYRRGDAEEALTYLEPAAAALNTDPIVIYHLGKVYAALGRDQDALKAFNTALAIAGRDDERAQFDDAREEIKRISAASQ